MSVMWVGVMDCFEYLDRISCCWRIYHAWVGNFKMADKVDEGHMSMTLHGLCLLHISQDTHTVPPAGAGNHYRKY